MLKRDVLLWILRNPRLSLRLAWGVCEFAAAEEREPIEEPVIEKRVVLFKTRPGKSNLN